MPNRKPPTRTPPPVAADTALAVPDTGTDLNAPDWLVRTLKPSQTPPPFNDMVRLAVAVPVPLAVGTVTGQVAFGLFAAMGALAASIAARTGPARQRLARGGTAALFSAIGLYVGHVAIGTGWTSIVIISALAMVSGLLSAINAVLSIGGLQLLVFASVASGLRVPLPPELLSGMMLVGGVWGLLLVALDSAIIGYHSPEREAVATVFTRTADLLSASGSAETAFARQELTAAVNQAYDILVGARAASFGRNAELRRLAGVLNATAPLLEAAVATANAATPPPDRAIRAVRALADAVRTGSPVRDVPPPDENDPDPLPRAIARGWRVAEQRLAGTDGPAAPAVRGFPDPGAAPDPALGGEPHPRSTGGAGQRIMSVLDQVLTGPDTWAFVARLVLCMAVAVLLRDRLPLQRPYWIMLTTAIVLKPDFGSVFARAIQRSLGTLLGVLIGAGVLYMLPPGPPILVAIGVFAALMPWMQRLNYGLFAVFLTPLVILLIHLSTPSTRDLVQARVLDTAIGSGIVLVVGYLLWPQTWRIRLGDQVAASVDALADYLGTATDIEDPSGNGRRRRVYRRLSDLRTEFQRSLSEPPPASTRASAWWPVIVQLERTTDAITELRTRLRHAADQHEPVPVDGRTVAALTSALHELGRSLRDGREPKVRELGRDDPLAAVAGEIDTTMRLARDPAREEPAPLRLALRRGPWQPRRRGRRPRNDARRGRRTPRRG